MFTVVTCLKEFFLPVFANNCLDEECRSNIQMDALNQDGQYQNIVEEVYDLIKDIKDPEKQQTLEELDVVKEDLVKVNSLGEDNYAITIGFVPTVPHCSLATLIGLCMKVRLERNLQLQHKLEIFITPGTHSTADEINKQINDKERVAAAMENPNVMEVVESCLNYIES